MFNGLTNSKRLTAAVSAVAISGLLAGSGIAAAGSSPILGTWSGNIWVIAASGVRNGRTDATVRIVSLSRTGTAAQVLGAECADLRFDGAVRRAGHLEYVFEGRGECAGYAYLRVRKLRPYTPSSKPRIHIDFQDMEGGLEGIAFHVNAS